MQRAREARRACAVCLLRLCRYCYRASVSAFHLLFVLFVTVPLLEIYLLIQVASIVGAASTIGLVVLTAVVGATLVRSQGLLTVRKVQQSLAHNELPAESLVEGALILLAGALLLTPGLATDAVGFFCLIPPWRQALARKLLGRHTPAHHKAGKPGAGRVIEGEFSRDDE